MLIFLGILSLTFLLIGHFFRLRRWENFIKIYEQPSRNILIRSLSLGYLINCFLPFRVGEIFRAVYAGRKMKSGVGFSLATILIDRLLDVLAVTFIFILLMALLGATDIITQSVKFYVYASLFLILFLWCIKHFSYFIKHCVLKVSSIFNNNIKLSILKFFWALINTFRDIWKIGPRKIFYLTLEMWGSYLISYVCFAYFLSYLGKEVDNEYFIFRELLSILFSNPNLAWEVASKSIMNVISSKQVIAMSIYMFLPIIIMFIATLFPISIKIKNIESSIENIDYFNILPQIEKEDQLTFLDNYFSAENRNSLKKYIELNRNISILADYSAGSNATTILCMDNKQTFWRKYAFDNEAEKLKQQLNWLLSINKKNLNENDERCGIRTCAILQYSFGEGFCYYDMHYDSNAMNMFRYIHTHPIENSENILKNVFTSLENNLYTQGIYEPSSFAIELYIEKKVNKNLDIIKQKLHVLSDYDYLIINGQKYKNLAKISKIFDKKYLMRCFSTERCSVIHGDLTIENIICTLDDYYIIDPNTGNILDSPLLDYGKIMQSLHGGYEFMMMTKYVNLHDNYIDFSYTVSSAYQELLSFYQRYLESHFSQEQIRNVYLHEIIHWLRLMPYKIKKDTERVPMFFAGLIMVANDVYNRYC